MRNVSVTPQQIAMIADALSMWQSTFLARNDDMSHMSEEEFLKARYRAYQKAVPALELLANLHGEAFRPTKDTTDE